MNSDASVISDTAAAYEAVFKRYETKYFLTPEQKAAVLKGMESHMRLDDYGRTTIRNIYYDTDTYRLVRRSIERPVYKEKLRVRCYSEAQNGVPVFVEIKKKYDSVVYKRRIAMTNSDATDWLCGGKIPEEDSQITREIEYFRNYYKTLSPRVFLSYEREAYFDISGGDFRVTFDENILARQDRLSLDESVSGILLLPENVTLMEIKTSGALPMWMTNIMTREKIHRTSFSKYGTAYKKMVNWQENLPSYQKKNSSIIRDYPAENSAYDSELSRVKHAAAISIS